MARLMITLVGPDQAERDVVVHAEPGTPLSEIASLLGPYAGSAGDAGEDLRLFDGSVPLDPALSLANSPLRPGSRIGLGCPVGRPRVTAGGRPVEARRPVAPGTGLARGGDGVSLDFVRSPLFRPTRPAPEFTHPGLSDTQVSFALFNVLIIIPFIISSALLLATRQPDYAILAGASPLIIFTNLLRSRRDERRRFASFMAASSRVLKQADEALAKEAAYFRAAFPDAAAAASIAAGPRRRLWYRGLADPDLLSLRVGTADQESAVRIRHPADGRSQSLSQASAPAIVRLRDVGVLGVAGPENEARALGRWLVVQAAILHSPAIVRVCLLTEPSGKADWEWVRWLPHCAPNDGGYQVPVASIANDEETLQARLAEISELIAERRSVMTDPRWPHGRPWSSALIVVLDGWPRLRSMPGIDRLLRDGPQVGVFAICLAGRERDLPAESGAVVTRAGPGDWLVQQPGRQAIQDISPDLVTPAWSDRVARALAPIRDASAPPDLPARTRLLSLLKLDPPTENAITARWKVPDRSAASVIGVTQGGPFALDLSKEGPNALVAGTTGAGKSELLRTIIASLAVTNRPDELNFLLIDYKGGAAFGDCVRLPHTVGLITDLEPHLVKRTIESLAAEVRQREYALARAQATDIDAYNSLRLPRDADLVSDERAQLAPMPRLLVIVDEFARLAYTLPAFVDSLVDIARRGRSVGIQLILASQRPAGAISSSVDANVSLRISLRASDPTDSAAVLGVPDAAYIPMSLPGRAYAAHAGRDGITPFQAGYIGGPWLGTAGQQDLRVADAGWHWLGRPEWPTAPSLPSSGEPTELTVLISAIRDASARLRFPRQRGPLLPPLPGTVLLGELPEPPGEEPDGALGPVRYGLEDIPAEQAQRPAVLDLDSFGHLLAVGAPRSGRSQLLRTIAGSIATTHSCADVHIYGVDGDGGALGPVTWLPHCGAVVSMGQADRVSRLIGRLSQEIERRKELLARGGFERIGAQRRAVQPGQRLPHLVVLLDGWERLLLSDGKTGAGFHEDGIIRMLRDGPAVGVHFSITANSSALAGRLTSLISDVLIFQLSDRADYALAGFVPQDAPFDMPAGRAFHGGSGTETQIALLDGEPTSLGQASALCDIGDATRRRDAAVELSRRPFQLDDALLVADRFHVGDSQGRPIGREDVLAWLGDRLASGGSVALLGPRRAGKTWVLGELRRRLAYDGFTRVRNLVIPQPSTRVDTPDELAMILNKAVRSAESPAETLMDQAYDLAGTADRLVFLLDEVGRLTNYGPAAVSWLRDLSEAGGWLVYTGTEKDFSTVTRWALTHSGSSFGNNVNAWLLGPLEERAALTFLTGTALNLQVALPESTAKMIVEIVGSWPFYLQVAGDAVVRAVQADDLRPLADEQALRKLLRGRLLDEWTHHFAGRWAEIGPAGRAALLRSPGSRPADLAPAQRGDLRTVGLLRSGDVWIADRPFFDWVARNATSLLDGEHQR